MSDERKAVFLSYASQDAEAAKRICESLRQAGVEVWFDQSELRGGDAWDQKIRRQIKECALFVPIVSANTQARREGYFRLEWKLADDRTHLMAKGTPFVVPVCIDDTKDWDALVPESFMTVQWTRLPNGIEPRAFGERVRTLLGGAATETPRSRDREPAGHAAPTTAAATRAAKHWIAPVVIIAASVMAVAVWAPWRKTEGATGAPAKAVPKPTSEAAQLAENAFAITQRLGFTRDDLTMAENLARRATDLEPGFARAWGVRAWVAAAYINRTWDRSQKRREETQALANRALTLNPEEPEALNAIARVLITQGAPAGAETMARRAIAADPDNYRSRLLLAVAVANQQRAEESRNVLLEALRREPANVLVRYDLANHYFTTDGDRVQNNAAALEQLDAILARRPFASAYVAKSRLMVTWKGDLVAMREALDGLERMPLTERAEDRSVHAAAWGALLERKPQRVLDATALTARDYFEDGQIGGPKAWLAALAHRIAGQDALERAAWQRAEDLLRQRLRDTPGSLPESMGLAATLAWQGKTTEAQQLIARPEATLRETRNPGLAMALARYHGALGDAAGAARYLKEALNRTIFATVPCLRLDPWWDKLRGQPEFEALLVEASAGLRSGNTSKSSAPPVTAELKSVAVLAFRQLGADPENEYLCEAIADELCEKLGRLPGLKVAASASAFSFKGKRVRPSEMAAQLGVAYLVDGRVQKIGSRVRVGAELIKAADESVVWKSDTLEHESKDLFAVQDQVVGAIAKNLEVQLGTAGSPRGRVLNPEAYRLYREGREAWKRRTSPAEAGRARGLFQQAIALDPGLGRAYAGLVDVALFEAVQADQSTYGDRNSAKLAEIAALAEKAVQLEPESAEVHGAKGRVFWHAWRPTEAEREYRKAIELNPNYPDAHLVLARLLHAAGQMDEALAEVRRAAELDPLTSRSFDNSSLLLGDAGRPHEALAAADRALELQPDSIEGMFVRMTALSDLERHAEASGLARTLVRLHDSGTNLQRGTAVRGLIRVLVVLTRAKMTTEARELFSTTRWNDQSRPLALAALGETEKAIAALDPAAASLLAVTAFFYRAEWDPARNDPRFRRFLQQVGWTEAHDSAQAWRAAHPPEKPATNK